MAVVRCRYCDVHIEWLYLFTGRRIPFNATPVPVEQLPTDTCGWVPARRNGRTHRPLMTPMDHLGRHLRAGVRHVMTVHQCPVRRLAP